jgi:hypothetical protein
MSWSIFKQEMLSKMENSSFKSTDEFADFFTQKYDQCMKRGLDLVTGNTVIKGNTELMRSTILYALEVGKNSKTKTFYNQSISLLGKGAIAYWTGAELGKIPPVIPAPGTILNLAVVSNNVTNPGVWPEVPIPVLPTKSNNPYLDAFIIQSTIHLTTISGFCNTISQYPPITPPGPAFLPFTGFNIPPSKGQEDFLEQIQQELEEGQDPIVQDDTPRVESKELDDFEKASNKKINKGSVIKRKVEVDAGSFNPAQSSEQIVSNDASDDNPRLSSTIYLNETWNWNWGGLFLYDHPEMGQGWIFPHGNTMMWFQPPIYHATSMISSNAEHPRLSIQLFFNKY